MRPYYNFVLITLLLLVSAHNLPSQNISHKWGEVTMDEMTMVRSSLDTSATAAILYDICYNTCDFDYDKGFVMKREFRRKTKFFTDDDFDYATITIPYQKRANEGIPVNNMEAVTYNLENGEIVKYYITMDDVEIESVSPTRGALKFTFPNVSKGSVVEYKYVITVANIVRNMIWNFQNRYPTYYSMFKIEAPQYINYRRVLYGQHNVECDSTSKDLRVYAKDTEGNKAKLYYSTTFHKYEAENIPPIADKRRLSWNTRQFLTYLDVELLSYQIPHKDIVDYSTSWKQIDHHLLENPNFGELLRFKNPYKSLSDSLKKLDLSDYEIITSVRDYVKSRVKWNGKYALLGNNLHTILNNKVGTNADINFIINSVLKDLGYKTDLVTVKNRTNGEVNLNIPSIYSYSTFILRIKGKGKDSTYYYLDGGSKNTDINLVPTQFLVKNARVVSSSKNEWVDLTTINDGNVIAEHSNIEINNIGIVMGQTKKVYANQASYNRKESIINSDEYCNKTIESLEKGQSVHVTLFETSPFDKQSSIYEEEIEYYGSPMQYSGNRKERVYSLNVFLLQTFSYNVLGDKWDYTTPVEFDYPIYVSFSSKITLPDNVKIVSIPDDIELIFDENESFAKASFTLQDNTIHASFIINQNLLSVPPEKSKEFYQYWKEVIGISRDYIMFQLK